MGKNISLGNLNIVADINYFNVLNVYKIGLYIGNVYIIIDEDFKTESDAYKYIDTRLY